MHVYLPHLLIAGCSALRDGHADDDDDDNDDVDDDLLSKSTSLTFVLKAVQRCIRNHISLKSTTLSWGFARIIYLLSSLFSLITSLSSLIFFTAVGGCVFQANSMSFQNTSYG